MKQTIIYQSKDGAIELKTDVVNETIWANRMQMAEIFDVELRVISEHIQNIYKEGELKKAATSSQMELVQNIAGRMVSRTVDYYNLEMIISVGYRINSIKGTKFRQWATKTLKQHDVLELIKLFSNTWFSLESYDKNSFPKKGTKKDVHITAQELANDLQQLKKVLIQKREASELFAQEKKKGNLEGIIGNVLQSVFGKDAYATLELKAAHLLYFIVKNHPFNDGNKRSGAFAFVWFLQNAGYNFRQKISPETLATITILVAESDPQDKDKMIGLILLILNSTAN